MITNNINTVHYDNFVEKMEYTIYELAFKHNMNPLLAREELLDAVNQFATSYKWKEEKETDVFQFSQFNDNENKFTLIRQYQGNYKKADIVISLAKGVYTNDEDGDDWETTVWEYYFNGDWKLDCINEITESKFGTDEKKVLFQSDEFKKQLKQMEKNLGGSENDAELPF